MERSISQEERIRRAEEIYNRRRQVSGVRVSSNNVNRAETKKLSLFKKMLMQLAICSVIYIIFYLIKNTNYIFSDDVISKTKEFLSYDINFGNIQNQITAFIDDYNKNDQNNSGESTQNANQTTEENIVNEISSNTVSTNTINANSTANEISTNSIDNNKKNSETAETNEIGGMGGAATNTERTSTEMGKTVEEAKKDDENKTQSELDIEFLKENYSFIIPVVGTITSRFGKREETEVVSANHAGIDIGANEGTPIYASMNGTVEVASSEGEYGKHIDIVNDDVLTRYAHCSKLLVKEGQKVKQGDKIAEVGSTGNSTGPHLHFEIRLEDRIINPDSILEF